jgi:hypothetical protein
MSSGLIVAGEKDAKKLKALSDYVESFRSFVVNNIGHYRQPIIMDALPQENEYEYLMTENGHYYRTQIKLTKFDETNYIVGSSSMEDIEALAN